MCPRRTSWPRRRIRTRSTAASALVPEGWGAPARPRARGCSPTTISPTPGTSRRTPTRAGHLHLRRRRLGDDGPGGVAHQHHRLVGGYALGAVGDRPGLAVGGDPEHPLPLDLDGRLVGRAGQERDRAENLGGLAHEAEPPRAGAGDDDRPRLGAGRPLAGGAADRQALQAGEADEGHVGGVALPVGEVRTEDAAGGRRQGLGPGPQRRQVDERRHTRSVAASDSTGAEDGGAVATAWPIRPAEMPGSSPMPTPRPRPWP